MRLKPLRLEQSPRRIFTANAGLALLGEAIGVARLEAAVPSLGPYRGASHAEVLATYLGLLTLGKSDFEAAEGTLSDPFFQAALGLPRGISAARLRQRLDACAMDYARELDTANQTFLERLCKYRSPRCGRDMSRWIRICLPRTTPGRARKGWATPTGASTATG